MNRKGKALLVFIEWDNGGRLRTKVFDSFTELADYLTRQENISVEYVARVE